MKRTGTASVGQQASERGNAPRGARGAEGAGQEEEEEEPRPEEEVASCPSASRGEERPPC